MKVILNVDVKSLGEEGGYKYCHYYCPYTYGEAYCHIVHLGAETVKLGVESRKLRS